MRPLKFVLPTIATFAMGLSGSAQTTASLIARRLTLQECIQLTVEHNLSLQMARIDPKVSLFNLEADYSSFDPNLTARFNYSDRTSPGGTITGSNVPLPPSTAQNDDTSIGLQGLTPYNGLQYNLVGASSYQRQLISDQYSGNVGLTLTQPLLQNFSIDSARQNILLAKKDLKISDLTLARQVMQTVKLTEDSYYELIAAQEGVKVQEKALQLAEKLYEENRKRVEVGALAPLDEKQAASRVASSKADLLSAQQTLATQQNIMRKLISDDYLTWHAIDLQPAETLTALPVSLNLEESWRRGLSLRPDFLTAKETVEKQDIVLRYQKNQLYPQLNLIGGYSLQGRNTTYLNVADDIGNRDNPTYSIGLTFSMPLSNRGPRYKYKSAQAVYEKDLLDLKNQEQLILATIDDSVKRVQTSFEKVQSTREATIYAEAALDAEQKKLENGKSTSFQVLQLQKDLTDARSQEIRALADYNKNLAQLALDEGSTLERNHIIVEPTEQKKAPRIQPAPKMK